MNKTRFALIGTIFLLVINSAILVYSVNTYNSKVASLTSNNDGLKEELNNTKAELNNTQTMLTLLQDQYDTSQKQLTEMNTSKIETELGSRVLQESSSGRYYLWITGEVYNVGFLKMHSVNLNVTLYGVNNTLINSQFISIGDIEPMHYGSVRKALFPPDNEMIASCTVASSFTVE